MNQPAARHWADKPERGNRMVLRLTTWLVKYLPAGVMRTVTWLVVAYYYISAPQERRHIARYQRRLQTWSGRSDLFPQRLAVYRQFAAFGDALVDRFAVWQRRLRYEHIRVDDADHLYDEIRQHPTRGQMFITSHLGNIEICRALVSHHQGLVLNVLMHSKHAVQFNRALKAAGADDIRIVQVTDLDAHTMWLLQQRLDAGEWLAIAADRIPVRGEKTVTVSFLGHDALLPQGPWLLAGLLQAPVNMLTCTKQQGQYCLHLRRLGDGIRWQRHNRSEVVQQWAQHYADLLAQGCLNAPLQWFNFYDFWGDDA